MKARLLRDLQGDKKLEAVKPSEEGRVERDLEEIAQAIKETERQQKEAAKVQSVVEGLQKELRRLAYSENAQRNLTKLQLTMGEFINHMECLTDEQKTQLVQA
jgi:YesN/AraC family two-component response regulator